MTRPLVVKRLTVANVLGSDVGNLKPVCRHAQVLLDERVSGRFKWTLTAAVGLVALASLPLVAFASDLRAAEIFASIGDREERSRALFMEAGKVIQHPRCLNCHPAGDRPTQGIDMHPHLPLVVRGADDNGAIGQRCTTCHQAANFEPSDVPGNALWHVAPKVMAWQTKTIGHICEQIKDPKRNGGKTLTQIQAHMAHDPLVGWAWHPGGQREPAPGTQEQLGTLISAWIASGAFCPR